MYAICLLSQQKNTTYQSFEDLNLNTIILFINSFLVSKHVPLDQLKDYFSTNKIFNTKHRYGKRDNHQIKQTI